MLRALEPDDAEAFASLVRRAFSGLTADPAPSAGRLTGADVRAHLASGGGGVTTGAGSAGLLWAEKEGGLYISRIAVDPGCRRQGLANSLLAEAEAEALRRGLPRLWLSTRLVFADNRRLFGRFGFIETTLHAHPGYAEPTYVDMEKRLGHEPMAWWGA